jgi:small subunit ribosomal protein S15
MYWIGPSGAGEPLGAATQRTTVFMTMTCEKKSEILDQFKRNEGDTGSPEVQIALLTERIVQLTQHLQSNRKDHASRRGLLMMVGKRTSLLQYLKGRNVQRYQGVIGRLGLRK